MRKYLLPLTGLVVLTGCMDHSYPGDEQYYSTSPLQPSTYYSNARPAIPGKQISSRHPDIRDGHNTLTTADDNN